MRGRGVRARGGGGASTHNDVIHASSNFSELKIQTSRKLSGKQQVSVFPSSWIRWVPERIMNL